MTDSLMQFSIKLEAALIDLDEAADSRGPAVGLLLRTGNATRVANQTLRPGEVVAARIRVTPSHTNFPVRLTLLISNNSLVVPPRLPAVVHVGAVPRPVTRDPLVAPIGIGTSTATWCVTQSPALLVASAQKYSILSCDLPGQAADASGELLVELYIVIPLVNAPVNFTVQATALYGAAPTGWIGELPPPGKVYRSDNATARTYASVTYNASFPAARLIDGTEPWRSTLQFTPTGVGLSYSVDVRAAARANTTFDLSNVSIPRYWNTGPYIISTPRRALTSSGKFSLPVSLNPLAPEAQSVLAARDLIDLIVATPRLPNSVLYDSRVASPVHAFVDAVIDTALNRGMLQGGFSPMPQPATGQLLWPPPWFEPSFAGRILLAPLLTGSAPVPPVVPAPPQGLPPSPMNFTAPPVVLGQQPFSVASSLDWSQLAIATLHGGVLAIPFTVRRSPLRLDGDGNLPSCVAAAAKHPTTLIPLFLLDECTVRPRAANTVSNGDVFEYEAAFARVAIAQSLAPLARQVIDGSGQALPSQLLFGIKVDLYFPAHRQALPILARYQLPRLVISAGTPQITLRRDSKSAELPYVVILPVNVYTAPDTATSDHVGTVISIDTLGNDFNFPVLPADRSTSMCSMDPTDNVTMRCATWKSTKQLTRGGFHAEAQSVTPMRMVVWCAATNDWRPQCHNNQNVPVVDNRESLLERAQGGHRPFYATQQSMSSVLGNDVQQQAFQLAGYNYFNASSSISTASSLALTPALQLTPPKYFVRGVVTASVAVDAVSSVAYMVSLQYDVDMAKLLADAITGGNGSDVLAALNASQTAVSSNGTVSIGNEQPLAPSTTPSSPRTVPQIEPVTNVGAAVRAIFSGGTCQDGQDGVMVTPTLAVLAIVLVLYLVHVARRVYVARRSTQDDVNSIETASVAPLWKALLPLHAYAAVFKPFHPFCGPTHVTILFMQASIILAVVAIVFFWDLDPFAGAAGLYLWTAAVSAMVATGSRGLSHTAFSLHRTDGGINEALADRRLTDAPAAQDLTQFGVRELSSLGPSDHTLQCLDAFTMAEGSISRQFKAQLSREKAFDDGYAAVVSDWDAEFDYIPALPIDALNTEPSSPPPADTAATASDCVPSAPSTSTATVASATSKGLRDGKHLRVRCRGLAVAAHIVLIVFSILCLLVTQVITAALCGAALRTFAIAVAMSVASDILVAQPLFVALTCLYRWVTDDTDGDDAKTLSIHVAYPIHGQQLALAA